MNFTTIYCIHKFSMFIQACDEQRPFLIELLNNKLITERNKIEYNINIYLQNNENPDLSILTDINNFIAYINEMGRYKDLFPYITSYEHMNDNIKSFLNNVFKN